MRELGLGATKNRLRNLLRYTDELLSFNDKITFDRVAADPVAIDNVDLVVRAIGLILRVYKKGRATRSFKPLN